MGAVVVLLVVSNPRVPVATDATIVEASGAFSELRAGTLEDVGARADLDRVAVLLLVKTNVVELYRAQGERKRDEI